MAAPSMSCPSGGQFYACASGSRFVGCCTINPCGRTSCPAGNLAATSFDAGEFNTFVDQQCSGGLFFTCGHNDPPFWGCCKSDPCGIGHCAASDLAGAFLSSNPVDAAPFLALNDSIPGSTPTGSSTISSAGHTTTVVILPTTQSPEAKATSDHSPNIGAIAGGAVGGSVFLIALILSLLWFLRRRRNSRIEKQATAGFQQPDGGNIGFAASNESAKAPSQTRVDNIVGMSPVSPFQSSPQLLFSPELPMYVDDRVARHFSHELPGSSVGQELDSGQRYHPYRQ